MEIVKDYLMAAPIGEVWRTLTNAALVEEWSGAPAEIRCEAGAPFCLLDGDVYGTNLTVEPPSRLVQAWFGGDWPEASIAEFTLVAQGSQTHISLLHSRVPQDAAREVDALWDGRFFGPLRELLVRRAAAAESGAREQRGPGGHA